MENSNSGGKLASNLFQSKKNIFIKQDILAKFKKVKKHQILFEF